MHWIHWCACVYCLMSLKLGLSALLQCITDGWDNFHFELILFKDFQTIQEPKLLQRNPTKENYYRGNVNYDLVVTEHSLFFLVHTFGAYYCRITFKSLGHMYSYSSSGLFYNVCHIAAYWTYIVKTWDWLFVYHSKKSAFVLLFLVLQSLWRSWLVNPSK